MIWRPWLRPLHAVTSHSLQRSARLFNADYRCGTAVKCSQLLSSEGKGYEGKNILINGTVRSIRKHRKHAFLHLSDGSATQPVQAICTPEQAHDLTMGTSIKISGTWAPSPGKLQLQAYELRTTEVRVLGSADPETYPLQKKYQTVDFLRTIPHLRLRTPANSLLLRARNEYLFGLTQYFHEREGNPIFQVQPPLITSSDCEGAGEVFTVAPRDADPQAAKGTSDHFFREQKYLTVSSQLHLEAYAAELGSVWALSPTFRAERSDTPRHLSEFSMLEVEVGFVEDLEEIMSLVEDLLRYLVEVTQSTIRDELLALRRKSAWEQNATRAPDLEARWKDLSRSNPWPRISYSEAMRLLTDGQHQRIVTFKYSPSWSTGLQLEHEKYLVETVGQGTPVFVTDYPKRLKPFYMLPSSTTVSTTDPDRSTVACFDLLLPELCEVVGGSLREHRLANLVQNMREHNLLKHKPTADVRSDSEQQQQQYPYLLPNEDLGSMQWYADLRRYGSSPHGGFGLGFDRLLCFFLGVTSVRDMVPFPRYFGKADC